MSDTAANHPEAAEEDLLHIVGLLDSIGLGYWLDGGWGVDVLAGEQTRPHRDIDIDYDASRTEELLSLLEEDGYAIETDEMPVRAELYSPSHGYLDIHPFIFNEDGTSKQANPEGGFWEFDASYFTSASYRGRQIPCLSPKGQKIFHEGYEPRDKDLHDLPIIESLLN